ncbi:DUF6541 family protein [Thermococcus sp.]
MPKILESKFQNLILALCIIMLSKTVPYLTLLLPWYLGFLLISGEDMDTISKLAVSPALGLGIVIIIMHILSWLNISLPFAYSLLAILTIGASLLVSPITSIDRDRFTIIGICIALFLSFIVKLPFFRVPAYPSSIRTDAIFHAYKSLEILKENTLFIKTAPLGFHGIITYPAGYHSIVVFLANTTSINVAEAMLIMKIFTWIFIPLGTYAATWSVFRNRKIAVFSAILAPISYLYYYYLNYSLLHQFLNYYMFLIAVSLYTLSIENHEKKDTIFSILIISALLLIHPYVYLAFESYALFAVLIMLIKQKKLQTRATIVFLSQATISFLMYYVLEYPIHLHIMHYTASFNTPQYALKDNLLWVEGILHSTFISEGQIILGIFFIVGMLYVLKHEDPFPKAIVTTILYIIFLVFNKILFHIPIPFYSGIWNSERIYVLITPAVPIIEGIGMYVVCEYIKARTVHPRVVVVSVFLLLMIPVFYVNAWNISFENAECIDNENIETFRFLSQLSADRILIPRFYDSGPWAGIYLPQKNITFIKNSTELKKDEGILYIDSRGYGDFKINPLNPWNLFGKYKVAYFNSNIWIFNLSDHSSYYPKSLLEYYRLDKDEIMASTMHDWRYLSYGFLLRHPAIIHGIKFEGWNIVIVPSGEGVIAFVPSKDYTRIGIEVYSGGNESINIDVTINKQHIGEIREGGYWEVKYPLKKGRLYIIELRGDSSYAFVRMKLEGGE